MKRDIKRKNADKIKSDKAKAERKIESDERKIEFVKTFDTTVIGAITFVAGLFWRDVATGLIDLFIPSWSGLVGDILTATLVTVIIVVLVVRMRGRTKKLEAALEKQKERFETKYSDNKPL